MAGSNKGVTDFLGIKPAYGEMANENIGRRAQEFAMITEGNALAANAGMKGLADIQSAQHYADAEVARGQAAGQSAMVGGIASGLGGLSSFMPKGGIFNKAGSVGTKASDFNLSGSQFSPGGLFG